MACGLDVVEKKIALTAWGIQFLNVDSRAAACFMCNYRTVTTGGEHFAIGTSCVSQHYTVLHCEGTSEYT